MRRKKNSAIKFKCSRNKFSVFQVVVVVVVVVVIVGGVVARSYFAI
jgi:hypothetical protein